MEYSRERVVQIAALGPAEVGFLLRRARGGSLEALADFVTHSLVKKFKTLGLKDDEAVDSAKMMIDVIPIELKVADHA